MEKGKFSARGKWRCNEDGTCRVRHGMNWGVKKAAELMQTSAPKGTECCRKKWERLRTPKRGHRSDRARKTPNIQRLRLACRRASGSQEQ